MAFLFLAFKVGKVSHVARVDKLSVVIATVQAIIFFGGKLCLVNGTGVVLIAIGVIRPH